MSSKQPDSAVQDARVLDEAAVIVLDRLAVEGGHAQRGVLFDRCKTAFWGRMVNAAARRAGYDGHDEDEVERRGREHLFFEAVNRLLDRQVIVVWDEEGDVLALHPTHREPLREGGPPYVPGTEFWRTQREQALTELRTQLLQLRDGAFGTALQKTAELYAQQIRRGQLADDSREEAIGAVIALADVLFQPARLAQLLHVPESEVTDAWQRRLTPMTSTPVAPKKRARQSPAAIPVDDNAPAPSIGAPAPSDGAPVVVAGTPAEPIDRVSLRTERLARNWTQPELGEFVGVGRTTISNWELGKYTIDPHSGRRLREIFAENPAVNGA